MINNLRRWVREGYNAHHERYRIRPDIEVPVDPNLSALLQLILEADVLMSQSDEQIKFMYVDSMGDKKKGRSHWTVMARLLTSQFKPEEGRYVEISDEAYSGRENTMHYITVNNGRDWGNFFSDDSKDPPDRVLRMEFLTKNDK